MFKLFLFNLQFLYWKWVLKLKFNQLKLILVLGKIGLINFNWPVNNAKRVDYVIIRKVAIFWGLNQERS